MTCVLRLGDCLEVMESLPENCADLVLCDPPYGTTACKWDSVIPFEPMWAAIRHVAKKDAAIVFTASQPFTSALVMSNPKNFKHEWVWDKGFPSGHLNAKRKPMRQTEDVLVFCFGKLTYYPQMRIGEPLHGEGGRKSKAANTYGTQNCSYEDRSGKTEKYPITVVTVPKIHSSKTIHPTQKPVDLMAYFIRTYSAPCDTVLDFTMGSGTTGVAALQEGRFFIGIENDEGYFGKACDRMMEALI